MSVVAPTSVANVSVPQINVITGISICPCVVADGEHLPTAIICDETYNISSLTNHKSTDFRFFFISNYLFIFGGLM